MIGVWIYPNGDTYEGEFADGKRNGKGVYHYANGEEYNGDWVDDEKNGKGSLIL